MHRGRHEPHSLAAERVVREANVGGELGAQARQRAPRPVALELDDVQRELVVPGDGAVLEFVGVLAGDRLEQLVGGGRDVEALAVDDHVLDLQPKRVEETQRCVSRRV